MSSVRIAVVRHVPDPARDEPRNVGVIGWQEGRTAALFMGEDEGQELSLNRVPTTQIADRQTYRDWVEHWRAILSNRAVHDDEAGKTVHAEDPAFLEALSRTTWGNYQLRLGAEAYVREEGVEAAVAHAFAALVGEPPEPQEEQRQEPRKRSHRELAMEAGWKLRSAKLNEGEDYHRNYRIRGRTKKGALVPAVFDFGVVPVEQLELQDPSRRYRKLLVDAVSLEAKPDEEQVVVDRARTVATKVMEVRAAEPDADLRALVTNGKSPEDEAGRYALSVLHDDAQIETLTIAELVDLVPRFYI